MKPSCIDLTLDVGPVRFMSRIVEARQLPYSAGIAVTTERGARAVWIYFVRTVGFLGRERWLVVIDEYDCPDGFALYHPIRRRETRVVAFDTRDEAAIYAAGVVGSFDEVGL